MAIELMAVVDLPRIADFIFRPGEGVHPVAGDGAHAAGEEGEFLRAGRQGTQQRKQGEGNDGDAHRDDPEVSTL